MIRGYKYRIYPNRVQVEQLKQMFGNARFVYNWALNKRIEAYESEKKTLSAYDQINELTKLKKQEEYNWLTLSAAQSINQSVLNLDKAYKRFFKEKKGFPRFKSKHGNRHHVSFPQNTKADFDGGNISFPKLGWIAAKIDRRFDGEIKTSTIEMTPTGKYFVSITVELPDTLVVKKPIEPETSVGIDMGIKTFATLSDGTIYENQRFLKKSIERLKVLQRRASKKKKGSSNRKKANLKVARLHEYVANQRKDFLHKTTTEIANRYATVACEDLNIAGMLKNHCLALSISDLGLGDFYRILKYKMEERGGNYLVIGRFEPSSKTCGCGVINKDLKLSDREWVCGACGITNDRDALAARNILKFAVRDLNKTTDGVSGVAYGGATNRKAEKVGN